MEQRVYDLIAIIKESVRYACGVLKVRYVLGYNSPQIWRCHKRCVVHEKASGFIKVGKAQFECYLCYSILRYYV